MLGMMIISKDHVSHTIAIAIPIASQERLLSLLSLLVLQLIYYYYYYSIH